MKTSSLVQIRKDLLSGNNSCLKYFFDHYSTYCIGTLIKKTRCSEADAEDLFMDSVLNFREKIITGRIENLTNIKAYLFSTCYRMWITKYKKEKSQRLKYDDIWDELYDNNKVISRRDVNIKLSFEALNSLGDKCRQVLTYFYIENKSMKEIAEILGFANKDVAKTTKSRCFKNLLSEVLRIQKDTHEKKLLQ